VTGDDLVTDIAQIGAALVKRIESIGDFGTAGPDGHEVTGPETLVLHPAFVDGWWSGAKRMDAHRGRWGGPIQPYATGLHTTDMLPEEWPALLKSWTERPGDGACANFLIGRDAAQGAIQLIPITRNSNHMGGPGHGVFVLANGAQVHPNLVANGIELHCAGGVRKVGGQWRLVERGVAHGAPLPDADVLPDPGGNPTRGLHKLTDYQLEVCGRLLADLNAAQIPMPAGVTTKAFGEAVPAWAHRTGRRVVTHVELDPVHRADPWPHGCAWLRARLA
jgi:hypothetical protein